MKEKDDYSVRLYNYLSSKDKEFGVVMPLDSFKSKLKTKEYSDKMYGYLSSDEEYKAAMPLDSFYEKVGTQLQVTQSEPLPIGAKPFGKEAVSSRPFEYNTLSDTPNKSVDEVISQQGGALPNQTISSSIGETNFSSLAKEEPVNEVEQAKKITKIDNDTKKAFTLIDNLSGYDKKASREQLYTAFNNNKVEPIREKLINDGLHPEAVDKAINQVVDGFRKEKNTKAVTELRTTIKKKITNNVFVTPLFFLSLIFVLLTAFLLTHNFLLSLHTYPK